MPGGTENLSVTNLLRKLRCCSSCAPCCCYIRSADWQSGILWQAQTGRSSRRLKRYLGILVNVLAWKHLTLRHGRADGWAKHRYGAPDDRDSGESAHLPISKNTFKESFSVTTLLYLAAAVGCVHVLPGAVRPGWPSTRRPW